jgi:hypothetical protein
MTKFIESYATEQLLPPYNSLGVRVHGFFFELEKPAIERYCDTFFNIGDDNLRKFMYKPLSGPGFGLIIVMEFPSTASTVKSKKTDSSNSSAAWDHLRVAEVYAAVPICRYDITGGNILVNPRIEWYQPVFVCGSPTSVFAGREVIGLESMWGEIEISDNPSAGEFRTKVSVPMWKTFTPKSCEQLLPFLDISVSGQGENLNQPAAGNRGSEVEDEPGQYIMTIEHALPELYNLVSGKGDASMSLVTLKQFRDARDIYRAVYQALVGAKSHFSNATDLKIYPPDRVGITFHPGDMVDEILRTFLHLNPPEVSEGGWSVTPKFAFSFTADNRFNSAETIVRFP